MNYKTIKVLLRRSQVSESEPERYAIPSDAQCPAAVVSYSVALSLNLLAQRYDGYPVPIGAHKHTNAHAEQNPDSHADRE